MNPQSISLFLGKIHYRQKRERLSSFLRSPARFATFFILALLCTTVVTPSPFSYHFGSSFASPFISNSPQNSTVVTSSTTIPVSSSTKTTTTSIQQTSTTTVPSTTSTATQVTSTSYPTSISSITTISNHTSTTTLSSSTSAKQSTNNQTTTTSTTKTNSTSTIIHSNSTSSTTTSRTTIVNTSSTTSHTNLTSSITTSKTLTTNTSSTAHANLTSSITTTRTVVTNTSTTTSRVNSTTSVTTTIRTVTNSSSLSGNTTSIITSTSSTTNATVVTTGWNPYTDFYNFINYGLFQDGGDCYGFSTTAVLYFQHYALGDQTYPYYPESASSVSTLSGQTGKYCLFGICLSSSDTLSQTTFPIYIHEAYGQAQLPPDWNIPSNEQDQAQLLMQSIQKGVPVVLAMGPTNGHAVVAYMYEQYQDGSLTIGISDPNYGNVPRTAYYDNGQFSYVGTETWSTFSVISPDMLQMSWLSPNQLSGTVTLTNEYYTYVFSSAPITIISGSGEAYFTTPGDSLTFTSTISGVVGFEEGSIQAYGIPQGVSYGIEDPETTSSMITVIIPQNETSIVGYQLTSTSSNPLNMVVSPTAGTLNVTTSTNVDLSVSLFSVGQSQHSILNASSIPISSLQSAVFSVPNWGNLNSTHSAASLEVFGSNGTQLITSQTLTNSQHGLPTQPVKSNFELIVVVVVVVAASGGGTLAVLTLRKRRSPGE